MFGLLSNSGFPEISDSPYFLVLSPFLLYPYIMMYSSSEILPNFEHVYLHK